MSARKRRRYLLLSTSVAALFTGAGVPAAYAACLTVANTTVPAVSNSSAIDCIDVENSHVIGNVTNTSSGTLTPPGAAPPSHTGITVNGSTIGGTISNAGTITLTGLSPIGILINDATVLGGISNSGTISAGNNGAVIAVSVGGTVATFGGGIINTGSISGGSSGGIDVNVTGRLSTFSGGITNAATGTFTHTSGISLRVSNGTLDTFVGGISNSGTMTLGPGNGLLADVLAGTGHSAALSSFGGGITNSGMITPNLNGIFFGAQAFDSATAVISNFSGGVSNAGTIAGTGLGGIGIFVGGDAVRNGSATLSTFSGGITNSGTLVANFSPNFGIGIELGGFARSGGAVTVGTFLGGISNSGTISYGQGGILVGGGVSKNGLVTIGSFGGGISNSGSISVSGFKFPIPGIVVGGTALSGGVVTISNFSGGISNSGTISADLGGILVGGGLGRGLVTTGGAVVISTFSGGITNSSSGLITAKSGNDIQLGGLATRIGATVSISTFDGGITNAGSIAAGINGVIVGGTALSGGSITISTFSGGISNSGTINHATANGIIVGGKATSGASVSVLSFSGDIVNSGAIGAGHGIVVGGLAANFTTASSVAISNFSGSIINSSSGTITANTGSGILVGGVATGIGATVTISTFVGNITNAGTITAATNGIFVGGVAGSGGSVSISNFSGNINNAGMISSAFGNGIMVGGNASFGSTVTIGTFAGGIANTGTINAGLRGVEVGGFSGFGSALTIGAAQGDIVNGKGGTITAGTGIRVGGSAIFGGSITLSTFAGNIVNSGSITATNSGLLNGAGIIVGGLAFGGPLSIDTFAGSIINNLGATITGNNGIIVGGEAFLGGAPLTIDTFAGGITNAGTISAQHVGIWVGGSAALGGTLTINTFAGGISNSGSINAGFIGIFVGGFSGTGGPLTISTFSGGITNSGTIAATFAGIAVGGVATFMGNVSNSGVIAASGVGIAICSCATLAGGGIVNTGLIVANTGIRAVNSSPINIFNSGIIIGSGGTAVDLTKATGGNTFTLGPGYSITGNVLGFGNDTFQLGGVGSDKFDLSAIGSSQQYQGFTTFNVVGGTWTVFNTFGQSQAWNVDGGILAGTGTLPALNVNNGGTLAPGNIGVPGTFMTVTGDLTFQPGAIYLVQLDPNVASRVNVGGAVSLAGAVEGLLAPGSYSAKTTYDILDPTSITGTFTGFTALNAPGFSGTLTYTPTEVLLNLVAQLGAGGGLNVNQQNVANSINSVFNNGSTLPRNFFPIFTLTGVNLANALTQLDGENATDAHFGVFQQMNQFLNLMLDPWVDGRHGWGGGGGGAFGFAPDQEASFPPDVALAYAGALKAPPKTSFDDRWTVWGSAFGGTARIAGDPVVGSTTVTASDYGFAAGMDYRASPDAVVGFALAGGGTNWAVAQGLGTGRSDAFMAGAYGTKYWGPAYLAGAVAFANHWLTTSRVALGDQLTANFTGQDFAGRVEAGYRYAVPIEGAEIGIAPYGALQTQWFHTPQYSETDPGGGGFGLTYNAATVSDTRSELGARFDDLVTFDDKPLMLHGRLAWAHDWISGATQTAAFSALPGSSFSVNGAATPADSALTTAMAEWRFKPRWSLTAKLDGEFARGAQTYAGTGMLRYWW